MIVINHRLAILILCLMLSYVRAATKRYIIYPREDLRFRENKKFTDKINELAGPQRKAVYTSIQRNNTPWSQIRFWCADLTKEAYEELVRDPHVRHIMVNEVIAELFTANESSNGNGTHLFRPTTEMTPPNSSASEDNIAYATQIPPVPAELRVLSQPKFSDSINHYPNYVYPVGDRPTYIYHIELGINRLHIDFNGRQVEWLYTDSAREVHADTMTEAAAGGGHSTCTASKAVGNLYGASKNATLVVVKMPDLEQSSVYEALSPVIDDIEDKRRWGTSVVSISWGLHDPSTPSSLSIVRDRLLQQIRELINMHVVVVCAAGNAARISGHHGLRKFVDTYPAWLYTRLSYNPDYDWARFIIVGNSDVNGKRFPDSQETRDYTQYYAPGVNIKCASDESPTEYKTWTGTSFSAPLVAGVIADLLSTGPYRPKNPFWWKRRGGENVVWNRVTDADNPPVYGSGNATLLNYTSPVFATTTFGDEQLDVSTS